MQSADIRPEFIEHVCTYLSASIEITLMTGRARCIVRYALNYHCSSPGKSFIKYAHFMVFRINFGSEGINYRVSLAIINAK